MKFCLVDDKNSFQPTFYNINKYGNNWMPHINMDVTNSQTKVMIAKIDPSWYGKEINDINWPETNWII